MADTKIFAGTMETRLAHSDAGGLLGVSGALFLPRGDCLRVQGDIRVAEAGDTC